jgi:hypothetical protein
MIIEAWQKTANDEAERSTEQIAFQGETDSKEAHPIQEEINYTKFKLFRRHIEKIYRIITIYNLQLQVYSKYEVGDKNLPSLKVDRAQSAAANRLPSSAEEGQRTEVEKIATGRLRPASAPTTR